VPPVHILSRSQFALDCKAAVFVVVIVNTNPCHCGLQKNSLCFAVQRNRKMGKQKHTSVVHGRFRIDRFWAVDLGVNLAYGVMGSSVRGRAPVDKKGRWHRLAGRGPGPPEEASVKAPPLVGVFLGARLRRPFLFSAFVATLHVSDFSTATLLSTVCGSVKRLALLAVWP